MSVPEPIAAVDPREHALLRDEVARLRGELDSAQRETERTLVRVTRLARVVTTLGRANGTRGRPRVAAEVAELFSADVGLLLLGDGQRMTVGERWGITHEQVDGNPVEVPDRVARLVADSPVMIGSTDVVPGLAVLDELGMRHLAWVRLISDDRTQGLLLLARRADRPFSSFDAQELRAVGSRVALMIANNRLERRTARHLSAMAALHDLSTKLAGTVRLGSAVRIVIEMLRRDAPESTIGVYRPATDGWSQVLAIGPELLPGQLPTDIVDIPRVTGGPEIVVVRDAGREVALLVARDVPQTVEYHQLLGHVCDLAGLAIGRILLHESSDHQARHDPLTGAANRTQLTERLGHILAEGRAAAVVFCDLDRFKGVNDLMGHDVGDRLLVKVAERMRQAVRPTDLVARLGGDEFVVVCPDVSTREQAVDVAERIRSALLQPITVAGRGFNVTTSQGLAISREGTTAESLLRDADTAMYAAKAHGRARYQLFDDTLRVEVQTRLATEQAVRDALSSGLLRAAYQPVIELPSGEMRSVEALLRYEDDDGELVAAAEFIEVAEESDLILELGAWILDESLGQLVAWRRELGDDAPRRVLVNVSGRQIMNGDFHEQVRDALRRHELPSSALAVELTESVLIGVGDAALTTVTSLREQGVQIGIDDFGTGWSSLTYLKRFPVDFVKVDREFVDGMLEDAGDASIVNAIVRLGDALGLETVAEGVETLEHVDALSELGCGYAQGFGVAYPMLASELTERLRAVGPRLTLVAAQQRPPASAAEASA